MNKLITTVVLLAAFALSLTLTPNTFAGAFGGGKYDNDIVRAHASVEYNVDFRGREAAQVLVSGDGDTDLDLYVLDENGRVVASDTDMTDTCLATWMPRYSGVYTIKIVNRGSVYNEYTLRTN